MVSYIFKLKFIFLGKYTDSFFSRAGIDPLYNIPIQLLLIQSQHLNNAWNQAKVNNKDTRTTSSDVFIVNLQQISHIRMVFPLSK